MAARSTTTGKTGTADKADDAAATSTATADPDTTPAPAKDDDGGSRSSGTSYLNVSGSVLVYDREGHSVGIGEWTPEVSLDAIGQAARRRDYLLPISAI